MAVYDDLVRELHADPARREALRAILLSEEVLALPERLSAFAAEVRSVAATTDRRLGALETDVGQLKVDVSQLKGDVGQLKVDVSQLKGDVSQLKGDVGQLKGYSLERFWRDKAYAYLGRHFRRLTTLTGAEISALLDDAVEKGRIDLDELAEAANADVVARGLRAEDRQPAYVVVEASWTVASSDVTRARRRAQIIQRAAGVPAVAVAGGVVVPVSVRAEAIAAEVLVFTDGRGET